MTTKNVSYSVNTTLDYTYYLNNVKDDDASGTQDFSFDMPAFSSAASFKVVSADSLFFTAGASTIGGTTSNSTGARYSISGNTLTMTIKIDTAYIDNSQGFAQQKHDVATQTTILTKQ